MRYLWLTPSLASAMIAHARAESPREACGLLVGQGQEVIQVIPVPNIATDPTHFYRMDESVLAKQFTLIAESGLSLLAFYHSHPAGSAIPSPTDIAEAHYPCTPYLIIGLESGQSPSNATIAAWRIHNHGEVDPVPVHVGELPPPKSFGSMSHLSIAESAAIILVVVIGFALVVLLSVWLLPPAPEIPR